MGYSILDLVLLRLREEGFTANAAYPGQKYPRISDTVASVHIEKVDRANLTVTLEVNIICPAAMGGTACEVEALRATEVLRWSGAVCVQNGCTYDGISQVYVVAILATFTGITDANDCTIGPGFHVYINDQPQHFVISVSEEEHTGFQAEYAVGQSAAVGTSGGNCTWDLRLEELIPSGSPETAEPAGEFKLKIVTDLKTEVYYRCRWTSIHREYTHQGLRRIRTGFSLLREEE